MIQSQGTFQRFLTNGVATQFGFTNKIFNAGDLLVSWLDQSSPPNIFSFANFRATINGVVYTYTVANVDADGGSTVTLTPALPNGTLDVRSLTPELQLTSIKAQGAYFPELHEEALDQLTREVQDLKRLCYLFGIHGPDTEATPWAALPGPQGRLGQFLQFDPVTGLPTVGTPAGTIAFGSYVADKFTATAGQKIFNLSATPASINNVDLSLDGASLVPGDDFTLAGNVLTLVQPALVGQRLYANYGQGVTSNVPANASVTDASLAPTSQIYAIDTVNNRTLAEIALGVMPVNSGYPPLNIKRYGAKGDGVTDDRLAIKTAWNIAVQMGGGRIVFPDGATYAVNSLDALSPITLPNQLANGNIGTQAYQTAFVFRGGANIDFDFQGSTLTTTITGGGNFILFDNCSKIRLLAPKIIGGQVMSTGVVAGTIVGGTLYTNGTYNNVPLTGGSGGGAYANITVAGGAVTAVTIVYVGGNYIVGDVLSALAANIGGTGSGFTFTLTSVTGAGPVVLTAAPNAVVACAVTGPTSQIETVDLTVDTMYSGFWAVADPTNSPANTVTQCNLRGLTRFRNGYYAVAFHNAGDNSNIDNLYAYRDDRGFFIYGAQNISFGVVTVDQLNFGFQSLIKAYSRSTLGVSIGQYFTINQPGQSAVVGRIAIQVQCDPAVISPPPTVQNVFINGYAERNISVGEAIEWDYYAGAGGTVLTATSSNKLFDNMIVKGATAGNLFTNVALQGAAAACLCDFDQFIYFQPVAANSVDAGNGFVKARKFGFTPAVTLGGGNTGMTFSAAPNCEYYIRGGILSYTLHFTLSAKGTSTGALVVTLPFVPRNDESRNPLASGLANSVAGLGGNLMGIVPTSGSATVALQTQGATGYSAVTDANLTNTSDIQLSGWYPV